VHSESEGDEYADGGSLLVANIDNATDGDDKARHRLFSYQLDALTPD
jgi:hypothetical protein